MCIKYECWCRHQQQGGGMTLTNIYSDRQAGSQAHPSSQNKLDLIEGGRTFSQNLLDKCVHTGPWLGEVQNKGQKSYLITLYIRSNMKRLDGIISFYKSRLSIHLW